MKKWIIPALFLSLIWVNPGCRIAKPALEIACAGDSLMRPMPLYLKRWLADSGQKAIFHEWDQGGLSSETYRSFFARRQESWQKTACDFILIQLGTNDAARILRGESSIERFEDNMDVILRKLKKFPGKKSASPVILLATVPLFAEGSGSDAPQKNRLIEEEINPVLREIARREGLILVDNYALLKGRPELYDPDGVHPSRAGEEAIARNWLEKMNLR
jgi:lysophospholipase L1-like esterase